MRLLVTNDDGYNGKGLETLVECLSAKHDVWVIAPDKNRSGVSHGINLTEPLRICCKASQRYTCSGVPVDCVINGLNGILPEPPDVIISGINKGANIGTDILFSGTCAAARQAALYGIPGIAVSIESFSNDWQYNAIADFVSKNTEKLAALCSKDIFVNINAMSAKEYKGWKLTRLSKRYYGDSVTLYKAPDGHSYSFFKGGNIQTEANSDSDFFAVEQGYISVSRVHAQPVSADDLKEVELNLLL